MWRINSGAQAQAVCIYQGEFSTRIWCFQKDAFMSWRQKIGVKGTLVLC